MRIRPVLFVCTVLAALCTATPAYADPVEVEAVVSPAEVQPGDTFTVTETVHNVHQFSILNPTLRLFSTPTTLTEYTELVSCTGPGVASCATVDGPTGPTGYQAILAGAMSGFESQTATFTLRVKPGAQGAVHTVQGQLFGRNYAIFPANVATLTVIDRADPAVAVTATPRTGLLVPKIDVVVRVTNNGPGRMRSAEVKGGLTQGLTANAGSGCTGGAAPVCAFGELAPGASATASFSVPIGLLHIGLPYQLSATKTASSPNDPDSANNSAATTCRVLSVLLVNCG
ncbi:DUF11 domain-containing protein [Kibdelosporangium phytohabitans]|uniref:DUF11 domain-containing protein n=1 Tax=Kibdelosporangium phytohabitans TaxID=860235 RepID=A0A0N9I294_9PSEU|nr:DUF11 domain-containing protein [Kibdelosporangium phytohabitans]ALG14085.1 hypothetical protein AOZ06_50905 [Kibdelosporangium phytohabitans]MBE1466940.1 hypothetical protein [Kibdelosporangium phytohabitans]